MTNELITPEASSIGRHGNDRVHITAKNLLHSVYQKRRLYQLSSQLYQLIIGQPGKAESKFAGERNLEEVRSISRIVIVITCSEVGVTWKLGYLKFDPWDRVLNSHAKVNLQFGRETFIDTDFHIDLISFCALQQTNGFLGKLLCSLRLDGYGGKTWSLRVYAGAVYRDGLPFSRKPADAELDRSNWFIYVKYANRSGSCDHAICLKRSGIWVQKDPRLRIEKEL